MCRIVDGGEIRLHFISDHLREVVASEQHVLRRCDDRLSVRWIEHVLRGDHDLFSLLLSFKRQRKMHGHLIPVEVRIEGGTAERMELDSLPFDQYGFEGLDSKAVEGRGTIEEDMLSFDYLIKRVPDIFPFIFDDFLRMFDIVGDLILYELSDDERLEESQCHDLRETALVHCQIRSDDDDAPS